MRVLIIGSGGREHAIVWKIAQSKRVKKIFCAPGNGGIAELAEIVDIKAEDIEVLIKFAKDKRIDLTVVGPEAPLVKGIVDRFSEEALRIFGPTKELAQLEGSKVFAKEIMKRFGVPTADFRVFDNADEAKKYIKKIGAPCVVKADGLAAGKGVVVAKTVDEAELAVKSAMEDKIFGNSGNRIIVEDCLEGQEVSIIVITDSKEVIPLASSQDHKRVFDGDKGPNCYSEDTEILTKDGWKRFNVLKENDEIAIFEPKSREIYFERPQKKYWVKYRGPMIQFKHRNIDLLVTPNHRMLLQQRYRRKKIYVREAGEYKTENYIFQSGVWKGEDRKFFILPEYDYKFNRKFKELKINFIDWVRFLAIYLSEGNVTRGKGSKRVYISQMKKSKNFNKIKKIIAKLPFKFKYEPKRYSFRIDSTQLATYLGKFGISHEKYVPDYVKNAKKEVIVEFLKAYNLGDGDIHHGRMRFCSSSKRLVDDLQEMMIKLDCSGVITVDKRKTMVNPINKKIYKARPIYSIEIKKRNKTCIRKNHFKTIDYDGYVGCVSVSTGFVLVRRNNRVAISGNTGGMGAYSPVPVVTKNMMEYVMKNIFKPVIDGLRKEGKVYKGILYGGLMITKEGPRVLEFNVRFGDPETQAIIPRMKTDIVEVMEACIEQRLHRIKIGWDKRDCLCVVISSKGYPDKYEKGKIITGLDETKKMKDIVVFHAGTIVKKPEIFLTNGGRVLGVTALGEDINCAKKRAYEAVEKIDFDGKYFRSDIGYRAIGGA